jgi:nicotinamide-nucleotide amidase
VASIWIADTRQLTGRDKAREAHAGDKGHLNIVAEVISVGDELTSGQRLDTNSQWLSLQLAEVGIPVRYHTTVADDLEANIGVFRAAVERADVVISTGGLGPTADDLTRQGIAGALDRELILDARMLAHIAALFARRQRPMPEQNRVQALFPEGSRPIPNPHGTAPGIEVEVPRAGRSVARLFALPGVPAEMRQMWAESVRPALARHIDGKRQLVRHFCVKCFGVGESDLEQMLPDLIRRGRQPTVGITAHQATITLRITSVGESEEDCQQAMQPTIDTIRQCLGPLVFGQGEDELEHAVIRLLTRRRMTLATAEWGSGGILAAWLKNVAEPRSGYRGGIVISGLLALTETLGIASTGVAGCAAISREVARHMAEGVRRRFHTDLGLAVSDFPPADADAPQFFLALATPLETQVQPRTYAGHPDILKQRAAKQALDLLRLYLLDCGSAASP